MKKIIISILYCLFFFSWVLLAQHSRGVVPVADSIQIPKNTYAIIIGISDYKTISDLNFADKDASTFYQLLHTLQKPKDPDQYELFLNEKANRFNICDAISKIIKKANRGDQVYFYFAGHGDIEDLSQSKNGLLLLYDSPSKDYFGMSDGVLQVSQLGDYFGSLTERGVDVYYIIDACHSGKLTGGKDGRRHTSNAIKSTLSNDATVLLSCDADQLSIEGSEWGEGRGLFSFYVQEGLLGLADFDNDQNVSLIELEQYVKRNTYLESDKRQTPVFRGKQNRILAHIEKHIRDSIVESKSRELKAFKHVYLKGNEENYLSDLDSAGVNSYHQFNFHLQNGNLIDGNENAYSDYQQFNANNPEHYLTSLLKRKLMISLNEGFDSIVKPLFAGKKPKFSLAYCDTVLAELDSCLALMEAGHYMYNHVLSRRYFLKALQETYGINLNNAGPLSADKLRNSIQFLHASRSIEPNASYTYLFLGIQFQTLQKWDSSMSYFEKYSALIPNSEFAFNLKGISLCDMGQTEESVRAFERAIQLNPEYLEAYTNLIYVYSKLGSIQEAINAGEKVIRISPKFVSAYNNLANLYIEQRNFKKAMEYATISESLNPTNPRSTLIKGKIYLGRKEYDRADSCFKHCIELRKDFAEANYFCGLIEKERGNLIAAMDRFRAYLRLDQEDPIFYKEVADCFNLLHERDSARYYYLMALRLLDAEKTNRELAGEIYQFGLRDPENANKLYECSDNTDPIFLLKKWSNLIYLQKGHFAMQEIKNLKNGEFTKSIIHYVKACKAANEKDPQTMIQNLHDAIHECQALKPIAALDANFDFYKNQNSFKDLLFPF